MSMLKPGSILVGFEANRGGEMPEAVVGQSLPQASDQGFDQSRPLINQAGIDL
jgi:hypothetical protein